MIDKNNESSNFSEVWLTVREVSELLNINRRTIQLNCKNNLYKTRMINGKNRKKYQILLSSLPSIAQNDYKLNTIRESEPIHCESEPIHCESEPIHCESKNIHCESENTIRNSNSTIANHTKTFAKANEVETLIKNDCESIRNTQTKFTVIANRFANQNQTLIEKIYSTLNHELIWGSNGLMPLNKFKANSGGYTASCPNPAHNDKKPSFLMKQGIPAGKCQSCGYHLSWFDAAALSLGNKDKKVRNKEFWQVINTLSSLNGGTHFELSAEEKEKYELLHETQNLRNALSEYLHKELLNNKFAEATRDYLQQRGVPSQYFTYFPMIGFYPGIDPVEKFLLAEGFRSEAIEQSYVLQKIFHNNCLIFSYKDEAGHTLGFKGRKPSLKTKDIKYQKGFRGELKDRAIMGLECCDLIIKRSQHVICLEGEFDWLIAQVECIKLTGGTGEFVCFGGSDVKPEKLQTLKKAGVKVLYFSFDPDTAGKKATKTAIKQAEETELAAFVINLPYGQDPDSFIKSVGFSHYQELVKNACNAPEWLAKEFLNKYPTTREGLEKAKIALLDEAKNYRGLTLDTFIQATTKELNLDKNSILHLINNYRQEQTKGPETQSIKANLPDAPAPDEFHIPTGWILNQAGLSKYTYTRDGLKEIIVAPAPFFVSSRSANIDTRNEKLEITYLRDKKWKTLYEERSILMDHRKIVQLSAKGFPVNSLNCKEIVNFIHSFEAINDEKFQKKATISGFGWKKEKGIPFFVMPDKAYGTDISIVFEPEGLGDERLAKALRQEGNLDDWKRGIRRCIDYPRVMFLIYASFTTPLLEILDAPNFIIDNWGLTSIGKTTAIEIAASVWGLPIKELGGLIIAWDATKVSIERLACLFNYLPIFLDDSQTANEKNPDKLPLYGCQRSRKAQGSFKRNSKNIKLENNCILHRRKKTERSYAVRRSKSKNNKSLRASFQR